MRRIITAAVFILTLYATTAVAQSFGDPMVATAIEGGSLQHAKALKAYNAALALENTALLQMGQDFRMEIDLQREFEQYLQGHLVDFVGLAMSMYGIYLEAKKTLDLTSDVLEILGKAPANSLAVGMHPQKNQMYIQVVNSSIDVIKEVLKMFSNKHPMTEQDRVHAANRIREKCRAMNRNLACLVAYLNCTTMEDIAFYILNKAKYFNRKTIKDIAWQRHEIWVQKYQKSTQKPGDYGFDQDVNIIINH